MTHTPNTPAGGLTATEIEILRDKIRLGKSVLPSEVHKLCDMALQSLTRATAGEKMITETEGAEWASSARQQGYEMGFIKGEYAGRNQSPQRAEDIQEEMRQLANKLLAEVKACLELNKAKGLDDENAVQQIIWFFNYVLKSYSSPRQTSEDEEIVRDALELMNELTGNRGDDHYVRKAQAAFDRLTQPPSGKMRSADDWHYDYHVRELFSDEREFIKAIQADASRSQD